MKIALFSSKFYPEIGGSEIVVDNLAREFTRLGAETAVVAPRSKRCDQVDRHLPYKVIRHFPFVTKRFGTRFYNSLLPTIYSQFPFEILHSQQAYPHTVLAAKLKERNLNFTHIFTSHGHDLDRDYPRYRSSYIYQQVTRSLSKVDGFVALNPTLKEQFLALNPEAQILEVTNGATFGEISLKEEGYILYLGRLSKRKGVELLLEAFKLLALNHPARLVIAGGGTEQARLQRFAQQLGLSELVKFVGPVDSKQKESLIAGARFLVVPTISWEACSLVVLEAICNGKGVIGSDLLGINHLIRDRENGLLVEPRNSQQLFAAMNELYTNNELRKAIEENNLKIRERYSWQSISQRYLEFYQHCLLKDETVASLRSASMRA